MKVQSYIDQVVTQFAESELYYGHGTDNATDEAIYLVYALLGIDLCQDQESMNRTLTSEELDLLDEKVSARIKQRIPTAYLVGKAWFAGKMFYCDRRALIPRSPIAELIGNRFSPLLHSIPKRILDLCAGGGCIGIACALEYAECTVDLVDISAESLALAEKNIVLHGLAERVATIQSDLYTQLSETYDLIVSNPPYVSPAEYAELPSEYHHEPAIGLLSEEQGLALPLNILRQAADYLQPDGLLILEVGYSHQLLAARLQAVPLLWLDFNHGGEGVLALTASQLHQYREALN